VRLRALWWARLQAEPAERSSVTRPKVRPQAPWVAPLGVLLAHYCGDCSNPDRRNHSPGNSLTLASGKKATTQPDGNAMGATEDLSEWSIVCRQNLRSE
jgi:hypothetical protein